MSSKKMIFAGLGIVLLSYSSVEAQTGWNPRVIVSAAEREQLKKTPIHLRPNRPLHFYGNTVRRQYYRNHPAPSSPANSATIVSPKPISPSLVTAKPQKSVSSRRAFSILETNSPTSQKTSSSRNQKVGTQKSVSAGNPNTSRSPNTSARPNILNSVAPLSQPSVDKPIRPAPQTRRFRLFRRR